jgi:hypothetical protein
VLLALGACTLGDLQGLSGGADDVVNDAATAPDTTSSGDDAGILSGLDAQVTDGCGGAGCFPMPTGFALVAFAGATQPACPTGYAQPADVVEGPTTSAGACTCGCSVTTQPSCDGTVATHQDTIGSGLCENVGVTFASGCGTNGFLGPFSAGVEHRFTPPSPTGGACSASGSVHADKIAYASQGRVCPATELPTCDGKICPNAPGAGFGACIAKTGDVACPAPFSTKHLVGTSASFTCGSGCTCATHATGCTGKFNYYASSDCSGAAGNSVIVNDTCVSSAKDGNSFASHKYVPDPPSGVTCSTEGTSSPSTPSLAETTTVCCQ